MKKWTLGAMALSVAMFVNSLQAEELVLGGPVEGVGCDSCCCGGGWTVDAELLFLRYHREGGLGQTNVSEYDFEASPRLALGYVTCDGLGARVRYWEYNQDNNNNTESVDTYNIDLELFQEICVSCNTTIEISAGIRYNDFDERRANVGLPAAAAGNTSFSAYGGVIGVQVNRDTCYGTLYARTRYAILMDDIHVNAVNGIDHKVDQTEVALGVSRDFCLAGMAGSVHAGAEWWNWGEYSLADDSVGFGGFVFGVSTAY
jgi:hypothetical protein